MCRKIQLVVTLRAALTVFSFGSIFLFSGTVLSQESKVPAANPEARYKLEGIVISSSTGEPIPRVYVQLDGAGDADDAMLTGADGRFYFEDVPEGKVGIFPSKPGFFDDIEKRFKHPRIPIGPETGLITMMLIPECVIYGHVEDGNGEPIENAKVDVIGVKVDQGRKYWHEVSDDQTDDKGNFRIADLEAGTYIVNVDASSALARDLVYLSKDNQAGYPGLVYYSDGLDLSSASPVALAAGQKIQINFSLKRQRLFHISGKLTAVPVGSRVDFNLLTLDGDIRPSSIQFSPQDGTFEAKVSAGAYKLRVTAYDPSDKELMAEQRLNISHDVANLHLVLAEPMPLSVIVKTQFTKLPHSSANNSDEDSDKPNSKVRVVLMPLDAFVGSRHDRRKEAILSQEDPDALLLPDVPTGRYSVEVWPVNPNAYVQSLRCGTTDLLQEDLVVPTGKRLPPIEMVLRDDGAELTGTAGNTNGNTNADYLSSVLVVPQFAPRHARTGNLSKGKFQFTNLAPGEYKVFAFDSDWRLEYMNPEVLLRYASRAVSVTVSTNGKAHITVDLIQVEK
jgi:hypothetical protein